MKHDPNQAYCRGCNCKLDGPAYHLGGQARLPSKNGKLGADAQANYYGGWVCSRACDYRASLEQYQDMPGCGTAREPERAAMQRINHNWPEQRP